MSKDNNESCNCNGGGCSCETLPNHDERLVFPVTDEEIDFIAKYNYEYQGLLQSLIHFTDKNEFDINKERYDKLLDEYLKAFVRFNVALDTIVSKNVKNDILNNKIIVYKSVDFGSKQLIILVK